MSTRNALFGLASLVLAGAAFADASAAPASASPAPGWWAAFGSAELDTLVREALIANNDVAMAAARIDQARATARAAGADRWPEATAAVTGSTSRREADGRTVRTDTGEATLNVDAEVDLWGRKSAAARAAGARLSASEYDRADVELSLQAEVAANYFSALALRDRLRIAEANRDAAERLMALVQVRFDNGAATALDIAQQRTTLLGIEAGIPALRQSLRESLSALAVLLGREPSGFDVQGAGLNGLKLPPAAQTQALGLLERRPDVRSAEARLAAAGADVKEARAALYPSLGVSVSAGVDGLLGGGTGLVSSVLASLTQTLFDGGKRRSGLAGTEAAHREVAANYAQTVLNAKREASDSLSALANQGERAAVLGQAVDQAREARRLALLRYEAGAEDLLALLDSQRSLLDAEDALVQTQALRYDAAADLFVALGGGWAAGAQ